MDPATAISLGSTVLGGIFGRRSAKKAARQRAEALRRAYGEFRSPEEIIQEQYTTGLYGEDPMSTIIGRERELIPQFQELAGLRARGIRDIQEESKLRQLGLLGELGGDIRGTLEDPRLARLAEMDIAEADRLSAEAAAPLSGERARQAEQTALGLAVRQGRGRDQFATAQTILGRTAARGALEQQAASARQRALVSARQAAVDPFKFLFGTPSAEERIFASTPLGTQVTDPGQAINIGSEADLRRAQEILGQGQIQAQKTAAMGKILGSTISGLGSALGGMDFGSPSSLNLPSFGGFTGNPATSIFGGFQSPTMVNPASIQTMSAVPLN
jgi:hypothetical protein